MFSSILSTVRGSASARTNVEVEEFTYVWIINNFKLLPQKNGQGIVSPSFWTSNNQAEWKLELFPQGYSKGHTSHVWLYLDLHSHQSKNINIDVHADLFILPIGMTDTLVTNYCRLEASRLGGIRRSEILESCASDDTVTIHLKMKIPCRTVTIPIEKMECVEEALDSQEGQLSQDFHLLYKESKFVDVTIIVGTQKFPAHKVVLAARSPVFSAMFEHKETCENLQHEVKIEEIEPAVVEAMLEFFYTDEVTSLEEQAVGLLEAAEKYDLPRLRIMCEKALYKQLTKENAAETLVHVDLHRSFKLKHRVMEFMTHHLVDVVESEGYKKMEKRYPELVTELMRSVVKEQKSRQ